MDLKFKELLRDVYDTTIAEIMEYNKMMTQIKCVSRTLRLGPQGDRDVWWKFGR
jgi:hypothetical protein